MARPRRARREGLSGLASLLLALALVIRAWREQRRTTLGTGGPNP